MFWIYVSLAATLWQLIWMCLILYGFQHWSAIPAVLLPMLLAGYRLSKLG